MPRPAPATIVIFAREPAPGRVKTRLIPAIGAAAAAALQRVLVERTLETAVAAAVGPVELCVTPDDGHPILRDLAYAHGVTLTVQGTGDLGARMERAFDRTLRVAPRSILVGTDCPVLSAGYCRRGAAALDDTIDAVLGPAEDGGYVLLGLTRVAAGLFDGIAWGGDNVCAEQRARFQTAGLRWTELEPLWDVDRPADLVRLRGFERMAAAPGGADA